jgi:transposase-like protein
VALGVSRDGVREVLGLWIADNEGAKFWLSVMTELKNRGLQDILIAVVGGLKGFPPLIETAFHLPGNGRLHSSLSRHDRANVHCPSIGRQSIDNGNVTGGSCATR